MRPTPATMSDSHLLDEYLVVYRDCGRRRAAIRAELESRLAAWPEIAKLQSAEAIAEENLLRLHLAIRFGWCSDVHAASLSKAGGEWAVKAVQDVDGLRAEVARLRASAETARRDGQEMAAGLHEKLTELRADLRDMLARLCAAVEHCAPGYGVHEDWCDITDYDILALRERMIEAKALLAKHKEPAMATDRSGRRRRHRRHKRSTKRERNMRLLLEAFSWLLGRSWYEPHPEFDARVAWMCNIVKQPKEDP